MADIDTMLLTNQITATKKQRRILCLDGGGVRGLITLDILEHLQKDASFNIDKFDLICGTSTGGFIAVGLALLGKSIPEMRQMYVSLGANVFKKPLITLSNMFNWATKGEYYDTSLLEKEILGVLREQANTKMGQFGKTNKPKVFVVTATGDTNYPSPFVCRSYTYPLDERPLTKYQAKLDGCDDFTLFEALRATSAAPGYFQALKHPSHGKFIDGGVVANNPIELAYFEAQKLFPDDEISLILSIGTGKPPKEFTVEDHNILKSATSIINIATDSEVIQEKFQRLRQYLVNMDNASVIRLNPSDLGKFGLDDASKNTYEAFIAGVRDYMKDKDTANYVTILAGEMNSVV